MNIQIKRTIAAPADALWAYLADFSNIHAFHPLLKGSHFIDGASSCEVGATRQCDMKDGNFLKERVVEWQPGSHYTIEVYESSMPMKEATATLGVRPLDPTRSEAYMHLTITPKYRVMQPMMYAYFRFLAGPAILRGLEDKYLEDQELALA